MAALAVSRLRTATWRSAIDVPAVAMWLLGFAPIAYLGISGGGYDPIVRSEVAIALWWIVLVGALVGVLPRRRMGVVAWAGLALLVLFAAWTGLSTLWTESSERTVLDFGKVGAYVGVLALALAVQGRVSVRHLLDGLASAVVLVAGLALLYRMHPAWFSPSDMDLFFPDNVRRLSFPLNYWNALAAFVAMGLPLVLRAATSARRLAFQALAAAALPMMALCVFLTFSRGGVGAVAVAVAVFIALAPDRLPRAATILVAAAGAAVLIAGADQREALHEGLRGALARDQGDELLAMTLVVGAGVGLVQVALGLIARHTVRPSWLTPSRGQTALIGGGVAAAAVIVALAAGLPSTLDREWQQFKTPVSTEVDLTASSFERLQNLSGNGRYQFWESAADANATAPLEGIGSGTYEFWWARNGTMNGGFIRDAHSLYAETVGELGWVGILLLGGFFAWVLGMGVARCISVRSTSYRVAVAAATAGCAAFAAVASIEWIWEIAVLPVAFMLMAAVVLALPPERRRPSRHSLAARVSLAVLAVAALVAVAVPLAGTASVRDSQELVRSGNLASALGEARTAATVQPYSASAHLQQALVLERAGSLLAADRAAGKAIDAEPTNWRNWFVRFRIRAERGDARGALSAYRKARALNPRSPLFAR